MWGRLSGVASNVAGLVVQGNDEELQQQLEETRDILITTREELKTALRTIEERDRDILDLRNTDVSTTENRTSDDIEKIRHKLAKICLRDDPDLIEDVISDISFSLSEKSSTIIQLQEIIDEMKEKQDLEPELHPQPPNSPSCDEFYESQISRLTELCTSLRHKEKNTITELEELRCELTSAKAEVRQLRASSQQAPADSSDETQELTTRLEEENRLLLSKVASEAAHKDLLRDQLDVLRETDQDKYHLLESIKEVQDALQSKAAELATERSKVTELTKECDKLQNELTVLLADKQKKLHKNLFEVKEEETEVEEIERVKVENTMLISKISDLMLARDNAREEIDLLTERMSTSRDHLHVELREKERELEDAMMIVSLLQEQLKSKGGEEAADKVCSLLEDIKEKNTLAPKVAFLQNELTEARKQIEELTGTEAELHLKLENCQAGEEDGSRPLASVTEEDEANSAGENSELHELITTAELLQDQYRTRCSTPPDNTEAEHLSSEIERLKDCLRAREELISGLREDIDLRQEKESSYREKVAELYSEIEKSQVEAVKDVIDFSDSFVSGLEEQLSVAQRILKIKDEEITGLNKAVQELTSRPITPTCTSPAPRFDSYLDNSVKDLNQKVAELNKQLVDEREESSHLQSTIDDQNSQIAVLLKEISLKVEDTNRIEKEYEAEMLTMSANFKDQKALNCEELGQLTENVEDLRSEIKELERDNVHLLEKHERVSQEYNALTAQIEKQDEGAEGSAIQAKYNLKEQQLNNALSEIDDLRETLNGKTESLNELENTLTEQREVNVDLQNMINELKDRCCVLENKESDYFKQIDELCQSIKEYETSNDELKDSLSTTQKELDSAQQKRTIQDTHIQHSIRDLGSALQELKLSKESLKADVQADLNNIAAQWSACVEETRRQALQVSSSGTSPTINSKITDIFSSIRRLHDDYMSIKAEVETMLHCDLNTIFPELKEELERIVEISAEKDEKVKSLEQEVQKYKAVGKKIIDKLKKQLKDKDSVLKKMASDSGDSAVIALQEANTSLTKQIYLLERDNDQLTSESSDLREHSVHLETFNSPEESLNCSVQSVDDEKLHSITKQVEVFIHQCQDIYQCQIIDNDFDICVFSTVSSRIISLARESSDKIQKLTSEVDEDKQLIASLSSIISELESQNKGLKQDLGTASEDIMNQLSLRKQLEDQSHALNAEIIKTSADFNERITGLQNDLDAKEGEVSELKGEIPSLDDLKSQLEAKDREISDLLQEVSSLREDIQSTHQSLNNLNSQESNKITCLRQEVEEHKDKNEDLQWQMSDLKESVDSRRLEIKKLGDKMEMLAADCEDKDTALSELSVKCEELERTVDTLSSQVGYLAEEKDSLEKSLLEKDIEHERALSCSPADDIQTLKDTLAAKTNECRKYMAMIKKLKMVKEENDRKVRLLDSQANELQTQLTSLKEKFEQQQEQNQQQTLTVECIDIAVEEIPEITETVQASVHTVLACADNPVITETNSALVHLTPPGHVVETRDSESQSVGLSSQEDAISSLRAEVVHLYSELRLFEDSCSSKEELIHSLCEQLSLSKQLLSDTKHECETKLSELQQQQSEHVTLVKQMQKEKEEEWQEKERQLQAKARLTEAETVRLMSGRPPAQDLDTVSEVSLTSFMSHDTSYLSISSIHREMPNDVESLQAELMKKNKLAFLIKTKAKKLESRVKDAKREADKSKAHDRVKEKILAVETELANITAQLKSLSAGKKIESQTTRIDPKYVEEMEGRLNHLTQVEQKYENLMEELQVQIHSRGVAEDQIDELNHTVNDLEDRVDLQQSELRDKDTLLCEHIDAAAEEEQRLNTIREKFEQQNNELLHLRDLNKKMKDVLIEVTDESARIEQTYKCTMHELEDDADQLKCDNATLSNELTNCWAKIEDLEEQNENYMSELENAHRQLRKHSTTAPVVDGLRSENETLTEQLNQYANANKELSEKLLISEREKNEVINQMHEECAHSKSAITAEKEKLDSIISDLESTIKESESNLQQELEASSHSQSELLACKAELDDLKRTNSELQAQLEAASSSVESTRSSLSSKLKHLQEEHSSVRNQLEESQYLADSLQQQFNIATEETSKTSVQLEKVHNQLNDILSDHEGCSTDIASLENRCSSLQRQVLDNNELIASLKEEQNVITESNMEVVREKDFEIERLTDICQSNLIVEQELTSVKLTLQDLEAEKEKLEQQITENAQNEESLRSGIDAHMETVSNLKLEREQLLSTLSSERSELEAELGTQMEKIEIMKGMIDEAKISYNELESAKSNEIESISSSKQALEEELSQLRKQIENLQRDSSAASNELSVKQEELEDELKNSLSSKKEVEQQIEELTATNTNYLEQLHDASYKLEQWIYYNEEQQQAMSDLQSQVDSLTEESTTTSNQLRDEVSNLTEDITRVSSERADLAAALSHAKNMNEENVQDLENILTHNSDLKSEKEAISQQLEDIISKETNLINKLDETKRQLDNLSKIRDELETKITEITAELAAAAEDKTRLDEENSELKTKIDAFYGLSSEESMQLRLQLEEKEQLITNLEQKLDETESLVLEKEQQYNILEESLKELDVLRAALSEKDASIDSLEQQLDDAYAGNEEALVVLNSKIENLKDGNSKLNEANQRLTDSKDVLEEGTGKLQDNLEQSQSTIESYEHMLAEWTHYGEQREAYLVSMNEQLATIQTSKDELQYQCDQLNESSVELSDKCGSLQEELQKTQTKFTTVNEEKESIAKKTKGVMKAYKESKMLAEKLKKEADKSSENAEQLQAQINDLTIAQAALTESNTRLSSDKEELFSEVEQFEVEREFMTTLKDENTALKQSVLEQSQRIDNLQSELKNITALESELSSYKKSNDSADNMLVEYMEKITHLERNCAEKDSALQDLAASKDGLLKVLESKSSEVEQFEVEREFMSTLKDENTALKQSVLEQSQMIDNLQSELKNSTALESELASYKEAKDSADNKLVEYVEKITHLERNCAEKASALQDLVANKGGILKELESKSSEVEAKDSEITELRSIRVQHSRLFEDLGLDFDKISEILPQLVSDSNKKDASLESLRSQVASFIQSIEDHDIVQFSETSYSDQFVLITEKMLSLSKMLQLTEVELRTTRNQAAQLTEETVLLKSVKDSLDDSDKTNEELRRKVEFLERDRSEHEHTVELLHQKFEENYQELASARLALAKKETELTDVTNQFQSTISNIADKEQKIRELELLVAEKDSEKQRIQQNFDDQIKHFHKSSADLQNDVMNHERELDSLRAEKENLEQEIQAKSRKISSVLDEMDGYKNQIMSLSTELASLQQDYEQVTGKLHLTETEFESVSEQLSTKDSTIHHLEDEINSLRRRLDAANSPDKDEELLNAIRQKEDVIEELRSELDSLQRDFRAALETHQLQTLEFDDEKTALSNEIKTLQNNLESVRADLVLKDQSVAGLSGQLIDLRQQLLTSTESNALLKAQVDEVSRNMSETKAKLEDTLELKDKLDAEFKVLLQDKLDLDVRCHSLTSTVQELEVNKNELTADLSKSKLDNNELQRSVAEHNKQESDVLLSKVSSLEELNNTLEKSLLKSEENVGEITANYEQKCMEIVAVERDLSSKKVQIDDTRKKLGESEHKLTEKSDLVSQLESDFNRLVANNAALDEKLKNFSSDDAKQKSSEIAKLKGDLDQALVDNKMLRENNVMLVTNNTQLTKNYTQLHDSVTVFRQRDTYLNDMCQKLQTHSTSLEAHIKTITEEFSNKLAESHSDTNRVKEELSSVKSGAVATPQVSELRNEVAHLKQTKEKLVSEVDGYQSRLKVATTKAETLEKSHHDITTRYNTQCGVVEKKTLELAKLTKQYKHIKQKLVTELNTRKTFVQETINGKEKVAIQFGEKSRRLKDLQGQLFSSQKDRETLTAAVEGILDCITPLRGQVETETEQPPSSSDSNLATKLENLEHKTKDILIFLSRPIPSPALSRVDLSAYRDSDLWSDYSRADSLALSDSDFGENRSMRSELSTFSELTNNSIQTNNQTFPVIRDRRGSETSSVSERTRPAEINRSSTGVLNRLAYNLIGDSRGRTPSGNT